MSKINLIVAPSQERRAFLTRRAAITCAAALALLAACSPGGGASQGEMALGPESAKVTVTEYASITCVHCEEFHRTAWAKLKENYIDTGKIRFVFRELPTAPEEVSVAGFQLARCGGADAKTYFERLDTLFEKQGDILNAYGKGTARDELVKVASGMSVSEDAFSACAADSDGIQRIKAGADEAHEKYDITGTPSFLINGVKLAPTSPYTYERIAKEIDAKLAGG